jgi:hypothetical protein
MAVRIKAFFIIFFLLFHILVQTRLSLKKSLKLFMNYNFMHRFDSLLLNFDIFYKMEKAKMF